MRKLLIILLSFISSSAESQVNVDSLFAVWNNESLADTSRLNAMYVISKDVYLFSDPDSGYYYAQLQFDMAEARDRPAHMADALNTQGISLAIRGSNDMAIAFFTRCMEIREEIGDRLGVAQSLNNIGNINKAWGKYDEAIKFYEQSMQIKEEEGDLDGTASTLANIATLLMNIGDLERPMDYLVRSLEIRKTMDDPRGTALVLNTMGTVNYYKGAYSEALDYFIQSLKLMEELDDKSGLADSHNNIGIIYDDQGDSYKAIEHYMLSLEYRKSIDDKKGTGACLNNIGTSYKDQGDYASALRYYEQSLAIREEIGDMKGAGLTLCNIGVIYQNMGQYDVALDYMMRSLGVHAETGHLKGTAATLGNLAGASYQFGEYDKAIEYGVQGVRIAQEIGSVVEVRGAADVLWRAYRELGQYRDALDTYKLYMTINDSIINEENQKNIIRQEYEYAYDKQIVSDSLAFAQQQELADLAQQAELDQEQDRQYVLYGGVGLLLLLGGVAFRGYTRKRRDNILISQQKDEVEHQKHLIEAKNQEIMDSITYAKRIQEAILPPNRVVKSWLPDSFVLYKPKEIVAGDFYWMYSYAEASSSAEATDDSSESEGVVLFAAADCTGHGVPGAMVSVVCHNAMNRSVREFGLTEPGEILDKTRELVVRTFEKSEEDVKDGMDVAMCALHTESRGENQESRHILKYAGANNPLWIIRDGELLEIKGDRQSVGLVDDPKSFTTHLLDLQKGDLIYIFSDGFADQFGGAMGKKYRAKQFKALLMKLKDLDMDMQRARINEAFEAWKGDLEQVDDVCVIGVRV